jgi:DNA-binding HxlR family transcriptional regulator
MDHFDRTILQLLVDTENLTFNEIQEKVDFTHNTLQQHLEELLEKGIIERNKQPQNGPGRPTYVYKIPKSLKGRPLTTILTPRVNWVVISFDSLQSMCRHEKGGYCKEIRGRCRAINCPKTLK